MIDQSKHDALNHLSRLVVFSEVALRLSFREAARSLGLSPSTITHHIKALEEVLGVRLIERTSRSMRLTASGQALLAEVHGVAELWRRAASEARVFADVPTGTLVVTAPDVVAERLVVPAIRRLTDRHPHVEVELRVSTANLSLLEDGIDVAVRVGPLSDSGHGARVLHRSQRGIFATPALVEAWKPQHLSHLDAAPWVQFDSHPEQLEFEGHHGQLHNLRGWKRTRATTAGAFIALIRAGLGFGLLPRILVADELSTGQLVEVLPDWSYPPAIFYALTPSPNATDAKIRLFIRFLVESFEQATTPEPDSPV